MIDWREHVRRRLPPLDIAPEREIEIVDELALQLEAAYNAALARGFDDGDARRSAEAEVPDWNAFAASVTAIEGRVRPRAHRAAPTENGVRGFARDLAVAWALILRAPAFSVLAVATLAVGLGVGTAAFVLIRGVLFLPLPYAFSERLVLVHATVPPEGRDTQELAYPDIEDLASSGAFSSVAAIVTYSGTTTLIDPPQRVEGLLMSARTFDVLGVSPSLGRAFSDHDGQPGATPVAMLGYRLWVRLGSPRDIVGKSIVLDEIPRTIVGVAPADFRFDIFPTATDVYLPITPDIGPIVRLRAVRAFRLVGRLADGVSMRSADAAIATVAARLQQAFPATNEGRTFFVRPLREDIVTGVRGPLWLVAALVCVVLLVVGVNLSSLLLSRAVTRARETAIRLALGATRWRLARESFAEALILATVSATAGFVLARALIDGLRAAPGLTLPRLVEVSVSSRTAIGLAVAVPLIAVCASVVGYTSPQYLHALSTLRTGHETADRRTGTIRSFLVAGQTSFAFVLLASAILLAVSLRAVLSTPVGFDTSNVVTMRLMVPAARYTSLTDTVTFYQGVLDALRVRSEIQGAGVVSALPLDPSSGSTWTIAGQEQVPEAMRPTVRWHWASAGYFPAIGIPIVRGRDFTNADLERSSHVTVINETLARLYFPGEDPIGKRVYFGPVPEAGITDWHEIVGIVGDARARRIEEPPLPAVFDLFGQHWGRSVSLAVRSSQSPLHVTGVVRGLVAERDPRLALFAVRTTSDLVATAVSSRRLLLWLVAGFAAIGFLAAVVGLYGTVAYAVSARTREMGVRIALGASAGDILRLVIAYGLRFIGAGIALGVVGATAMGGFLENQLVGVRATEGYVLALTAVVLTVAACIACLIPAARAVRVDAVSALKAD
jgi:predicted permease